MKFTVLGAAGYIGSRLVTHLRHNGHECAAYGRCDTARRSDPMGHAIYCIGLTADFRHKPFETVRAHVSVLADALESGHFESFLYLSSTRLYAHSDRADEDAAITAAPADPDDLYNVTKLAGESLCLSSGRRGVRIARLSNVYGADFSSGNFLASLIRAAVDDGRIRLRTGLDSEKDYVSVESVAEVLPRIASTGRERLYNVASGRNFSNRQLVERLVQITGCAFEIDAAAVHTRFPIVDVRRIRTEFGFESPLLLDDLSKLVTQYKGETHAQDRR